MNPAAVFAGAQDYPVAIDSRNKVTGYVVGKKLFEKMVEWMENQEDVMTVRQSEFPKGKKAEDLLAELGL